MDFIIRIANTNILIHSVYTGIYNTCKNYLIDESEVPDIEIHTNEDMIRYEMEHTLDSGASIHSEKMAERFLVQRLIAEALLSRNIILMHGAVVEVCNASYMFTGRSGTGKTTHIQKWLEKIKDARIVNGDKPLIILNEAGAFACGTPWCGKENLGTNAVVPLRSIVFMERSEENYIETVPFKSIFPKLLEQTYRPANADKMKKTLELLLKLKDYVVFYRFRFNNFKEDSFRISFDALSRQGSI